MPVATGSIAFLGAARFQGHWNASTNAGSGSGLDGSASGQFTGLLVSGAYGSSTNLTASTGDYWQITGSGTTNINGHANWNLNDWCIYSGSAGATGVWQRLAFEDTIASVVLGDLSSSSFHMGSANNQHVIFATGSVHSGSNNFVFDYVNSRVGIGTAAPAKHVHVNGASGEVELRLQSDNKFSSIVQKDNAELIIQNASAGDILFYDDGAEIFRLDASADSLLMAGTKKIEFNDSSQFIHGSSATVLSLGATAEIDLTATSIDINGEVDMSAGLTVASGLTASSGLIVPDDKKLRFGDASEAHIEYNEDGDNLLVISGSAAGAVISGSTVGIASNFTDIYSANVRLFGANLSIQDDKRVYFGDDSDAYIEYDEAGGDTAVLGGSDWTILDDKKLYFGADKDAHIEYNEDGDNYLIISGSAVGTVISGSKLQFVSPDSNFVGASLAFDGTDLYLQDNKKIAFGNTADAYILYDETTSDTAILGGTDWTILDDKKLHFGTGLDSSIEYDEDGTDSLIFSGSAAGGLVLSGSTLMLDSQMVPDTAIDVAADSIPFFDADGSLKRETIADFTSGMAGYGLTAASGQLALHFAETGGVTLTSSDSIMILDNGTSSKRVTVAGHGTYLAGDGLASTSGVLSVEAAQAITSVTADLTVAGGDLVLGATAVAGTVSGVTAAADTAGNSLTIQAGSALAGDSADTGVGGNVLIQGGAGKGTADGGSIIFKSATAAGGSSTALNAIDDTILTLASDLSSTFAGAVDINGALTVDGAGVSIDSAGVAANFTVASDGAGEDLTISLTGATDSSLILSSTGTGADALQISTSAGGMDITVAGAGANEDLDISCNQEINITSTSAAANAIYIRENGGTTGTIKIHADQGTSVTEGAASIQLLSDAGGIGIKSTANLASAVLITADGGTSETIKVHADQGTGPSSIGLFSDVGGITLNAAAISTIQDLVTVAPFSTVSYGTDGMYGGNVIKYSPGADDTLTVGQIYFLHTDGTWDATDADAVATGASQLLGIGLGSARSVGVFTRGLIRIPSTEILNLPGSGACDGLPVYVSTTAAHLDFTPPSASGDFVRIVGYAIDDNGSDVLVYFDPDKTWIEVA